MCVNDNAMLRQDVGVTNSSGECVGEEVFQFSFNDMSLCIVMAHDSWIFPNFS